MRVSTVVLTVVLFGCGGPAQDEQDPTPETPGTGARVMALTVEADRQTAPVEGEVRVTATVTTPTALSAGGQLVNFVVVSGGGSVFAGSAQTDANGQAKEVWKLGTRAGDQIIEVRAVDQVTGNPIVHARLTATATPGPAVTYAWSPGRVDLQAGQSWDHSTLTLIGYDQYGNRADASGASAAYRSVVYEGPSADPTPTCTVSGTLITCPASPSAGSNGTPYRVGYETSGANGARPEVQIVIH